MTTTIPAHAAPATPWPAADPDIVAPVEEHDELRQIVRRVLDRLASQAQVRDAVESERGYSQELWRLLNGELAIGAVAIPETLGGHGYGMRELGVILEEAGAALLPEPVLTSSAVGCQALAAADRSDDVARLLGAAMAGELVVAVGLDAEPLDVRADGNGLRADGAVVRLAHGAVADTLIAPAAGPDGALLVIIDTADTAITPQAVLDPTRRQANLLIDAAPARVLAGPERYDEVMARLRLVRDAAVAAEHAGAVARLLDLTVEYVTQRQQFGRPIGSFQAIKHRLADVLTDRERALSAARYAVAVLDAEPGDAALPVTIAAAVCTDALIRTAHETVQLHGGIGFTWEHSAHLYLRRALGDEGLYGDGRSHRQRIADLLAL